MINFDNYDSENKTEHNPNWPYTPEKPYRILIISRSGAGKTNVFYEFNRESSTLIKNIFTPKIRMKQNINI